MIEKKFKDLVLVFLQGEISPAEIEWLVGDLHARRDRRDLFAEAIEYYLENEAGPARRVSDQRLRDILLRDLSKIEVRDLELAMPRRRASNFSPEEREAKLQEGEAVAEPKRTERVAEILFDKPPPPSDDRSMVLPIVGVLIIVLTFFLMVRFSSLKNDEEVADAAELKKARELSDAAAFRQANEFISESNLDEDKESADEGEEIEAVSDKKIADEPPVSLVDLVGGKKEAEDSTSDAAEVGDQILIFNNP
ncbi:hypothetical protein [Puniceicoccus vermicola]|nr:hypothetical protein [Puniceicoccus vermicola]